eukprot:g14236.t1
MAYVLAPDRGSFEDKVNKELVQVENFWENPMEGEYELVKGLISKHAELTGSSVAKTVLSQWSSSHKPPLVRVIPKGYREVLLKLAAEAEKKILLKTGKQKAKMSKKQKKVEGEGCKKAKKSKKVEGSRGVHTEQMKAYSPESLSAAQAAIADLVKDDNLHRARPTVTETATPRQVKGFMDYDRSKPVQREPGSRVGDWENIYEKHDYEAKENLFRTQAARCMACGVPFCQSSYGCPLGNKIPSFNNLVYEAEWKDALNTLELTNNFPEFTGSICPAPCEGACTMGATGNPAVTIKQIELAIVEKGFEKGWIRPRPPLQRTGKRVAVVGSGPAGLAASAQLNKAGHEVHLFERDSHIGGLLMYGIPNPKLSKTQLLERRIFLLQEEGIVMHTNTDVVPGDGTSAAHNWGPAKSTVDGRDLLKEFDIVLLATGALVPRSLKVEGSDAPNIHHAMEFLVPPTRSYYTHRGKVDPRQVIDAKGKRVVVIGGHVHRREEHSPASRAPNNPWPEAPYVKKVDYAHEEAEVLFGHDPRVYQCMTERIIVGEDGLAKGVQVVEFDENRKLIEGTRRVIPCELILLAMGYLGADPKLGRSLGVHVDARGNLQAQFGRFWTNVPRIYTCGDSRRGASTVVWAISEGRQAAREIDRWLMGHSHLP